MKKEHYKTIIYCLLYKTILEIVYVASYYKIYAYTGITLDFNLYKYILSTFIAILFSFMLSKYNSKFEVKLISICFLFTIIPLLSVFHLENESYVYTFMYSLSFLILIAVALYIPIRLKKGIIIKSKVNFLIILLIFCLIILFIITVKYGLADSRALNLSDVYEVRSERQYSTIMGYLISFLTKSFIPILMLISLYKRKQLFFIIAILLQFYMFLFTGTKSTLFSIPLILFSYYLVIKGKNFLKNWCILLSVLLIISVILVHYFNNLTLISILPGRLQLVPAHISYTHYEFFSVNTKLYYSETLFGKILGITSSYPKYSGFVIGEYMGSAANANTGFLASAFDNGGILSMLIDSSLIGLLISFISKNFKLKHMAVCVGVFSYSISILNDGALTQVLLTGGILVSIILILIFTNLDKER